MTVPQELLLPLGHLDKDTEMALNTWALQLISLLNKGLSLDNLDAAVVSFTSNVTPNTEDTVAHKLGRIPSYFIVADIDKAGNVYRGPTAFTNANVFIKTSVASAAVKLILL